MFGDGFGIGNSPELTGNVLEAFWIDVCTCWQMESMSLLMKLMMGEGVVTFFALTMKTRSAYVQTLTLFVLI